ncbi:MAG: GTPase HflX [Rhodothermales bacterium]|nr:GTPase HflX [Rhodothermales bacterium]
MTESTPQKQETAIVVGVVHSGHTREEMDDSLDELELLADTAGARVTDRIVQVAQRIHASTYIGSGKVEELAALVAERESDLVIFDDDLSPKQLRNIEKQVKCKLLDRSALILDIFARRAKTATAKTQVELAQLEYLRTRLTRQWTHLSRQKGGIGTKGPGETQIETDRRLISNRIATLKERLNKIDKQRTTQRKGRQAFTRVSLVGYTNAGKSTLMNVLADAGVFAEDRLFATLDPTTRQVELEPGKEILLSDTVGFIRKLPHGLIESFKSTLDEVRESDVLLHVVDVTHPCFEDHIQVVNQTLKELDAQDSPTLMVFNKVDRLEERGLLMALREEYHHAVFVSALRGIGMDGLKEALLSLIQDDFEEHIAYVPVAESRTIAQLHQLADVTSEEYLYTTPNGEDEPPVAIACLRFRVARELAGDVHRMVDKFAGFAPIPT